MYGFSVDFKRKNGFDSYLWNNGSVHSSIEISKFGKYWVEADNGCEIITDTIEVIPEKVFVDLNLFEDTIEVCNETGYNPQLPDGSYNILWSDENTEKDRTIYEEGAYWVNMDNGCEVYSDSFYLKEVESRQPLDMFDDTINICDNAGYLFEIPVVQGEVLWSDGKIDHKRTITEKGLYWVNVIKACDVFVDSIYINLISDDLLTIPNAFSPNSDGINDFFELPLEHGTVELFVYNRWGEIVYESMDYQNDWDGNSLPSGEYYYFFSSTGLCKEYKGMISIVK
ncbi:gliding motility-associated C-terminal domain-containing protein [Flammeovirgaceae bacterium SG7u.111]|nr:gliding motility-associated C-terminal domain-containing protein [Flammeovirgaceae bacterium SG7u.132]WPO38253.1 gliding motility-associated C-terminal domain-containing protein [Flammeovirgaceae bacterium SG7u.111]